MNCPYCNYPNSMDSRFCENCGAPLPPRKSGSHTGLIIIITAVIIAAICGVTVLLLLNHNAPEKQTADFTAPRSSEETSEAAATEASTAESPELPATLPATRVPETTASGSPHPDTILFDRIPDSISSCTEISAINASSSSTIVQSGYDNSALCLIDGREETSWQEGVSGSGIGEYVEIQYEKPESVKCIAFQLGNWRDEDYFYGNNRPKTLTLTFDGSETYQISFPSEKTTYYLEFSTPITFSHMKASIDEVYPGTSWDDTCIAEITAYANP